LVQIVYGGLTRKNEIGISKMASRGFAVVARGVVKKYDDTYDTLLARSKLSELFEEGEDAPGFLIRFALTHPDLSSMVVGTSSEEHLLSNIKAAERGRLSNDIYAEAKMRLDGVGVTAEDIDIP